METKGKNLNLALQSFFDNERSELSALCWKESRWEEICFIFGGWQAYRLSKSIRRNNFFIRMEFLGIRFLQVQNKVFSTTLTVIHFKIVIQQSQNKDRVFLNSLSPSNTKILKYVNRWLQFIPGDPGAVSGVDKMFVMKVYCKLSPRTFYRPD